MNKRNCGAWKHQPLSVSNIEQVSKIKICKHILVSKFRVALKVLYVQVTDRRHSSKLTPRQERYFREANSSSTRQEIFPAFYETRTSLLC